MAKYTKQKLGDICRIEKGRTGIASAAPGEYPLVVTAEERKTCGTYQFDCEAVCIPLVSSSGHGKKSLKNVHYQSGKFALGSILCAVIPNNPQEVNARYLHQYLQFYKDTVLVPLMKGAANVSLSMRDIAKVEIPLPDFDTQAALAKTFVEAQEKQKQLNAEFEKQTEYASRLRQNILQEAIEGKLTAEWRKAHPVEKGNPDLDAQALFEQIQKEKEGKAFPCGRTSLRPTPSAGSNAARNARLDDEQPFEIPDEWKWVRLGEIFEHKTGKTLNSSSNKGTVLKKYITTSNLYWNTFDFTKVNEMFFTNEEVEKYSVKKGDLLVCEGGDVGRSAIWNYDYAVCYQNHIHRLRGYSSINIEFYYYILYLYKFSGYINSQSKGMGIQGLSSNKLDSFILPLPPLAEQKEIFAKVESLLAKVTELEDQIQERKKLSVQLMQTILKNAFAPQK